MPHATCPCTCPAFIQAIEDAKAAAEARKRAWAEQAWHVVGEPITFKKEAERLGLDPKYLRDLNGTRLKGLQLSSLLKKDTWLQVRPLDEVTGGPPEEGAAGGGAAHTAHMVNRVVRIDGEDDYEYWYVPTFVPDLLAPSLAPSRTVSHLLAPSHTVSGPLQHERSARRG